MGINDIKIFDGFIDYCKKLNVNDYYKERYQSHYDCIEKVVGYYYYKKTTDNNDYGFIEFYKYIPDKFVYILNNRLSNQIDLPRNSYELFCSLDIVNDNKVNPIVKQKQYILKMTNIFPKNFTYNYIIHFMELLSISRAKNMCFPRDIIMKIAGHLFI